VGANVQKSILKKQIILKFDTKLTLFKA
jgi:hypothetical protein